MDNTPAPQPDPKPKSRRGGKRPGAGAPKGNLNALKHGRRSRQFHQIGAVFASNTTLHAALIELGRRHLDKQLKAEEVATALFTALFEHAKSIARGEKSQGPFAHIALDGSYTESREIKQLKDAQSSRNRPRRRRSRTNPQEKSEKHR